MKVIRTILLFVVCLLLNTPSLNHPSIVRAAADVTPANIRGFHLLTAADGWLWQDERLYWTTDGGQRWHDITPDLRQAAIRAVFFVDAQRGWLLLSQTDSAGEPAYALARTADAGQSWQTQSLTLFQPDDPNALASATYLHFVDAQTGWLVVKRATSSAFSEGALFKTSDGGSTWTPLSIPIGESVYFLNDQIGWTVGGAAGDALYRTQNGGRTWSPQFVATAARLRYQLPTFANAREGVLPVVHADDDETTVAFYRSADAGQSWQHALSVPITQEPTAGAHVPLSVLDTQHWLLAVPNHARLLSVANQREVTTITSPSEVATTIVALDMATSDVGWAKSASSSCARDAQGGMRCTQTTQLLRTRDGGRTWQSVALPASAQSPADQTRTFTGQGFDSCSAPSVAQMQNWFANSPYRVWNLYLGGSSLYRGCTPLTLAYVSPLAQQGWKFIPTWVGPQAPCTSYTTRFSVDLATAYAQGASEADAALDRAASVGLATSTKSGIILYFDLEYFNPNDAACREAAKSFISGWSGQLRARGNKAGVYGHFKVLSDFAQIANVPDDVWIAQWQTPYAYNSGASVYGIPNMPDTLWSNQQRLHQYTGGHDETWGGVTLNIDSDVLDGAVATLPCYTLSVGAGAGGTTATLTSPNCGVAYIAGTNVQVQASPNAGYLFSGWSGSRTGLANPLTLVVDGNQSVSASFALIQSRLYVPIIRK